MSIDHTTERRRPSPLCFPRRLRGYIRDAPRHTLHIAARQDDAAALAPLLLRRVPLQGGQPGAQPESRCQQHESRDQVRPAGREVRRRQASERGANQDVAPAWGAVGLIQACGGGLPLSAWAPGKGRVRTKGSTTRLAAQLVGRKPIETG